MYIGMRIILSVMLTAYCYWFIVISKRNNVKNPDEFREANLIKKIDMIFTEENDLLHANKKRDILGMAICIVLIGYLVISCFKR
mgnify:CR=1 FL=1